MSNVKKFRISECVLPIGIQEQHRKLFRSSSLYPKNQIIKPHGTIHRIIG